MSEPDYGAMFRERLLRARRVLWRRRNPRGIVPIATAARLLKVDPRTIRRWAQDPGNPACWACGRRGLVFLGDVPGELTDWRYIAHLLLQRNAGGVSRATLYRIRAGASPRPGTQQKILQAAANAELEYLGAGFGAGIWCWTKEADRSGDL